MDSWNDLFDRAASHEVGTAAVRAEVVARRGSEREAPPSDEEPDGGGE